MPFSKIASAVAEGGHQGYIYRLAQTAGRKLGHLIGHVIQALHIPFPGPSFHEIRKQFQYAGGPQTAGSTLSAGFMDKEFKDLFKNSKGFCIHHFRDLVEDGEKKLSIKEKQEFYPVLFSLMEENMKRLEEEVTWFCDKQDYLNRDKDWGNSKDSIQRAIQKLGGGYPADPVFKIDY